MLTLVDQNAVRHPSEPPQGLPGGRPQSGRRRCTQYSSHKLRHTAATLMLQNGVDVRTLQEVLGHDHLNTTQIYTHVDNEDLRTRPGPIPGQGQKRNKIPDGQDGTA